MQILGTDFPFSQIRSPYQALSSYRLKTQFSQPPVVGNGKSQCLSSRGLPEEFETHPDVNPSAIIEGVMAV